MFLKTAKLLVLAVLCLSAVTGASAQVVLEEAYPGPGMYPPNGNGLVYYMDSFVQLADLSNPTNYFYWELTNYSLDTGITSWTWGGGLNVFDLGLYGVNSDGPLPFPPVAQDDFFLGYSDIETAAAPVLVNSTITFSNGDVREHMIYVPVPEPGAFVALAAGLSGLGLLRRKR